MFLGGGRRRGRGPSSSEDSEDSGTIPSRRAPLRGAANIKASPLPPAPLELVAGWLAAAGAWLLVAGWCLPVLGCWLLVAC